MSSARSWWIALVRQTILRCAAPFRIAADDLDRLSNAAVLKTLRADRKLASAKAEDFEAGLSLLDEAIRDTERRLF
jgi:hypothetical protein